MQTYISDAIAQHGLPASFSSTVINYYKPLATMVAQKRAAHSGCLTLGVQGTQGSGKSTLADFLRLIFEHEHNLNCAILSIDDFYLTQAERTELSERVHPLLQTRGVPGTHDVELAISTIASLKNLQCGAQFRPVRFNKAIDDRELESQWQSVEGPIDIVILEGWCVGLPPQPAEALECSANILEEQEDNQAIWRKYVNQKLTNEYASLFELLDALVVLNAPSFDCVYNWRLLQEQKLADRWAQLPKEQQQNSKILSPEAVKRFISHYQRLTEHALQVLPRKADWLLPLGQDHKILDLVCSQKK